MSKEKSGGKSGSVKRKILTDEIKQYFAIKRTPEQEQKALTPHFQIKPSAHKDLKKFVSGLDTNYAGSIAEHIASNLVQSVLHNGKPEPKEELSPKAEYHLEQEEMAVRIRYLRDHPSITDRDHNIKTVNLNIFAVRLGLKLYNGEEYKEFPPNASEEDIKGWQVVISNDINDKSLNHLNIADPERVYPNGIKLSEGQLQQMRAGIYQDFSLRGLCADADCNPGNIMISYDQRTLAIGGDIEILHIDFGHAFNDLIKGRNPLSDYQAPTNSPDRGTTLEFLNRRNVNGFPIHSQNKLHKYYRNIMPNLEFAEQLMHGYDSTLIEESLLRSQMQLQLLLEGTDISGETRKDIYSGLHTLSIRIGKPVELAKDGTIDIDKVFANLHEFVEENNQERISAGRVMKIQTLVEDMVKSDLTPDEISERKKEIEKLYEEEQQLSGKHQYLRGKTPTQGKVEWIITEQDISKKSEGYKGTLVEYLIDRYKQEVSDKAPSRAKEIQKKFNDIITSFNPQATLVKTRPRGPIESPQARAKRLRKFAATTVIMMKQKIPPISPTAAITRSSTEIPTR